MVAAADGSIAHPITDLGDWFNPQWSPDARHVLAVDGRTGGGQPSSRSSIRSARRRRRASRSRTVRVRSGGSTELATATRRTLFVRRTLDVFDLSRLPHRFFRPRGDGGCGLPCPDLGGRAGGHPPAVRHHRGRPGVVNICGDLADFRFSTEGSFTIVDMADGVFHYQIASRGTYTVRSSTRHWASGTRRSGARPASRQRPAGRSSSQDREYVRGSHPDPRADDLRCRC